MTKTMSQNHYQDHDRNMIETMNTAWSVPMDKTCMKEKEDSQQDNDKEETVWKDYDRA